MVKVKGRDQSGEGGAAEQTIKAKLTSGVNISLFLKTPSPAFYNILISKNEERQKTYSFAILETFSSSSSSFLVD